VALELYQRKLTLFRQLRQHTAELLQFTPHQLVHEEEPHQRVLQLLDEREQLMKQIDELDLEIAQHGAAGVGEEVKQAILAEMAQLRAQNAQLETVLQSSMAQLREQAKTIQEGRQSQRAYFGSVSAEGAFIDKRR